MSRSSTLVAGLAALTAVVVASFASRGTEQFGPASEVVVTDHRMQVVPLPPDPRGFGGSVVVVGGELQNNGSRTSGLVRVVATFRDAAGTDIGESTGYQVRWGLSPGGTDEFRVTGPVDPRVATYALRVEELRKPAL